MILRKTYQKRGRFRFHLLQRWPNLKTGFTTRRIFCFAIELYTLKLKPPMIKTLKSWWRKKLRLIHTSQDLNLLLWTLKSREEPLPGQSEQLVILLHMLPQTPFSLTRTTVSSLWEVTPGQEQPLSLPRADGHRSTLVMVSNMKVKPTIQSSLLNCRPTQLRNKPMLR